MLVAHVGLLGVAVGFGLISQNLAQNSAVVPAAPQAAAEWAHSLPQSARAQALHGILVGWAESEPEAAIRWAKNLGEREDWMVGAVIGAWSRKDPGAAARWATGMPDGPQKNQALEQVGQAWGAKKQQEAMVWAEKLQADSDRRAALGGVVQSWAMQDGGAAIKYAEEQKDVNSREHLLSKAIYGWSLRDRPAAEEWIKKLPEGDLKKAIEKTMAGAPVIRRRVVPIPPKANEESRKKITLTFETPPELAKILVSPLNQVRQDAILRYVLDWFGRDKEKAPQWISAKLEGYVLGVCAGTLAKEWSKTDLAAAAGWVRQVRPFFRDFMAKMGAEWAVERPKEVAEAVLQWPDDSRRHVVLRGVCEAWAQKDPAAALKWIEVLPQGSTRTGALKGLVIGWSQSDGGACRAWADKITDENEKKEARHYIIHGLARSNPEEAIAYLKTETKGEPDLNLIYCLGKEWALGDAPAAAEWAKSLPGGPQQEAALQAVLRQWVYADAVRSAEWAQKLPQPKARNLALYAIMEKWMEQNPQEALGWARQLKDSDKQAEALAAAVREWGRLEPQDAIQWVNHLPEGDQKNVLIKQIAPFVEAARRQSGGVCGTSGGEKIKLGQDAPLFITKTVDGQELKLADYKGKFVLLDFWATWCGPCLGETPHLKEIFEKYGKRKDFAIIGLSLDNDPAKPAAYAKASGCGWVNGFLGDWGKDEVTKQYGVRGIPSIWLIGPDGKVVANNLRGDAIMSAVSAAFDSKK